MASESLLPSCCPSLEEEVAPELFAALGDPTRIALVGRLLSAGRPLTVTEASTCCGIHFSGVSRHLTILLRAGILRKEKRGREVLYELEAKHLARTLRGVAKAIETGSRLSRNGARAAK